MTPSSCTNHTWNPLKRTLPPEYTTPVNAFQFQRDMIRWYGLRGYLRRLLPALYRDEDGTWRILGPRWDTRTCNQDVEWCLFMIQRTHNDAHPTLPRRKWEFEGPSR